MIVFKIGQNVRRINQLVPKELDPESLSLKRPQNVFSTKVKTITKNTVKS